MKFNGEKTLASVGVPPLLASYSPAEEVIDNVERDGLLHQTCENQTLKSKTCYLQTVVKYALIFIDINQ